MGRVKHSCLSGSSSTFHLPSLPSFGAAYCPAENGRGRPWLEPTADHGRSRGHVGAVDGSGRSPLLLAVRLIHRSSCVYLGASLGVSA